MESFDLNRTSNIKVDSIISKRYGGRYSRSEKLALKGAGIGGLLFYDQDDDSHLKCNLELVRNGLVIYFRNLEINKVLLFPIDELASIELKKEADMLVSKKYSIFKRLLSLGFGFYNARIFLFDQEIIADHKPELIIQPKNYQELKFYVHRRNPWEVANLLHKIEQPIDVKIELNEYEYVG